MWCFPPARFFGIPQFMTNSQDFGKPKKRGRPQGRAFSAPVSLRLPAELDAALSAWIAAQSEPRPTRPEAIRSILAEKLEKKL